MTILEHLYAKYGITAIDSILRQLNHGDRNYALWLQYISLSDNYIDDNINYYHSNRIPLIESYSSNKRLVYEISNLISEFDFTYKRYNTCITYGTFDLFHIGHLNLLRRIREQCSNLIVAVSTDEFNKLKGKVCTIPYEQRSAIVSAIQYVTKVIPEDSWDQKPADIKRYHVDCFMMGDDWSGKFDYLSNLCEVKYLTRTPDISTTEIKASLK